VKRVAVFASGSGTNFQSLIDASVAGALPVAFCGLVASKEGIGAIERARSHRIPVAVIKASDFPDESCFSDALTTQLKEWNPDVVVLAGYLSKIPRSTLDASGVPFLNIHPSLLPNYGGKGFYGLRVHQAVLEAGDAWSGCTVHLVDSDYDTGRILAQERVSTEGCATPEQLAALVLKAEHRLLPAALKDFLATTSPESNTDS
jgi:phosphoribosylglycinamide formyltransferase-1